MGCHPGMGGGSGLVLDVRDLLKEQEVGFQHQIRQGQRPASDETTQLSALMSYQLLLKTAAASLRELLGP